MAKSPQRGRLLRVCRRIRYQGRRRIQIIMETRDRKLAAHLCNWWAQQDSNAFYYVGEDQTSYYAPREDIEALGLPSELDWDTVWPDLPSGSNNCGSSNLVNAANS